MALFRHCMRKISPKAWPPLSFMNAGRSKLRMQFYSSGNTGSQPSVPSRLAVKLIFGAAGLGLGLAATSSYALANTHDNDDKNTSSPDSKPSSQNLLASAKPSGPVVTKSGQTLNKLKVFVGYDPREDAAYEVCRHSILKHATIPVEVIPIKQPDLRNAGLYWRSRGATESTEFSFSRFLTPFLAGFDGWAVFVDCDFLYTADIRELAELIDDKYAIMCVKHDYTPKSTTKMDGAVQTVYPRKNWSSMVLYNCSHPKNRVLTPDVVNSQTGAFLHRFMWLDDDDIGSIPFVWNFLVGHNEVDEENGFPKAIHYTSGGPWFEAWKDCEFADLWIKERDEYVRSQRIQRVIQDELVSLVEGRMDEKSKGIENRAKEVSALGMDLGGRVKEVNALGMDLGGRVKEVNALENLLSFNMKEMVLADASAEGVKVKEPSLESL